VKWQFFLPGGFCSEKKVAKVFNDLKEVEEFLNWYSQKYILIRGPKAIEILYNGDFYFFF